MKGFIEVLAEHEIRGWAFDERLPYGHVTVMALLDGEVIGQTSACVFREDLRTAGLGDGDHEFNLTLDPAIAPSALLRVEVNAVSLGQVVSLKPLERSNKSLADAASNFAVPISDPDQNPVFILGPARSGTSALALALLKSGRYEGHGEGHLLPLARVLLTSVDEYYDARSRLSNTTLLRATHSAAFQRMIRRGFVQLTRSAFPTGYWIDKTPTAEMVRCAPLMREIWPNARFVFMKRRVIEVVLSRRRKFPNDTLENHYLDWADVMSAWLDVRPLLGSTAIEVEQLEMARSGRELAARLEGFLELPPSHKAKLGFALHSDHPEQTSDKVGKSESLDALNLELVQSTDLRIACDDIMSTFGYSYDEQYFC